MLAVIDCNHMVTILLNVEFSVILVPYMNCLNMLYKTSSTVSNLRATNDQKRKLYARRCTIIGSTYNL
uniref:Uncharacterized protein n=1 Tax=Aegilops tauschii subsp. strangulata TaxID=200361 RepID=A0A453MMY0_AEGTS